MQKEKHLLLYAQSLLAVDLKNCTSIAQIRSRLLDFQSTFLSFKDQESWLNGLGWDQTLWNITEFPTFLDLDVDPQLSKIPIALVRIDAHAIWLNGLALNYVKPFLNSTVLLKYKDQIMIDKTTGNLTGLFLDDAMSFIQQIMPQLSESFKLQALKSACQALLKFGITTVHDAGVPWQDLKILKKAVDLHQLPLRVYAMVACPDQNRYCGDQIEKLDFYKNRLTVRSVKLVMDGALGSWGALMLEPFSDLQNASGILRLQGPLSSLIEKWLKNGFQVNIHCIGDKANRLALDAFEKVKASGQALLRSRIEHAQLLVKTFF
jgi:predicted amidohydrolase YtcJ